MTTFQAGDRVRAWDGQGPILVITQVRERVTPFGNYITYWVRPEDKPDQTPTVVVNGHLLLRRVGEDKSAAWTRTGRPQ